MAQKLEDLSIDELEAYRDDLQLQIEALKAKKKVAGQLLDLKRQLAAQDLDAELEKAKGQVTTLQTLQKQAGALNIKTGGE